METEDWTPKRDSGPWWNAYVERMSTDAIFEKQVRAVVDERHEWAEYVTRAHNADRPPHSRYVLDFRLRANQYARVWFPSPCPFEDGWRPSGNLDPLASLTDKFAAPIAGAFADWPSF